MPNHPRCAVTCWGSALRARLAGAVRRMLAGSGSDSEGASGLGAACLTGCAATAALLRPSAAPAERCAAHAAVATPARDMRPSWPDSSADVLRCTGAGDGRLSPKRGAHDTAGACNQMRKRRGKSHYGHYRVGRFAEASGARGILHGPAHLS
jgi:hypothetical protein